MDHDLFKPKTFEEGRHAVTGDCNGIPMEERWKIETPLFVKAILKFGDDLFYDRLKRGQESSHFAQHLDILDYGCGVGRLSKEIIKQTDNPLFGTTHVVGVDASTQMMEEARKYVDNERFSTCDPQALIDKYDIIYLIYVLQHCPAIEIREVLARIHSHLKDDGIFVYCSSDYRMAIRFDSGGFFDDRFLGINLQEEVGRLFDCVGDLFDRKTLDDNPVLKTMIEGGLQHPAKVYKKKNITDYLHIGKKSNPDIVNKPDVIIDKEKDRQEKIILINRLAPGDILVMTNAIRDLHKSHPGKYLTDVRTPCNDIFNNNPYITKLQYDETEYNKIVNSFSSNKKSCEKMGDILIVDMQYPLIHRSGLVGSHFSEGHRDYLETVLGVKIQQTEITPEIYLTYTERDWVSPVIAKSGYNGKYWIINAGSKGDFTLKQYPFYQEVVDLLIGNVKFVQIGQKGHNHIPINGTVDMIDKTNVRELFRSIWWAEGVLTCVSFPMHIAAAFKKPCVVVAGAREGTRWELYPNHQFMYVNGCIPCATYDGCWKSRTSDCTNKVGDTPKCLTLITPEDISRAITRYYDGGILKY